MDVSILSVIFGSQFLFSAWTKYRDADAFFLILKKYPLPVFLKHKSFARLVIIFEFLIGISLISLQETPVLCGLLGVALFISTAAAMVAVRLIRGERKIQCGCGEALDEEVSSRWVVLRNLLLLVILFFGIYSGVDPVGIFSVGALKIYLSGFGLFAVLNLLAAILRGVGYIRQWKAVG